MFGARKLARTENAFESLYMYQVKETFQVLYDDACCCTLQLATLHGRFGRRAIHRSQFEQQAPFTERVARIRDFEHLAYHPSVMRKQSPGTSPRVYRRKRNEVQQGIGK